MQSTHTDYHPNATTAAGKPARALDLASLSLLIIGGLNWGLVGLFGIDLVATLFGEGSALSRVVYALVGLAALYGIVTATRMATQKT
jgi:uncharacterized membrane protein YuzA (DUF378 family)